MNRKSQIADNVTLSQEFCHFELTQEDTFNHVVKGVHTTE